MRSIAFFVAALASSAFAIQITYPGVGDFWTTVGPNRVAWNFVATDPTNFTVTLVTPDQKSTELAALVNTADSTLTVPPPSAGFVVGTNYTVNFVSRAAGSPGILAQSAPFNIVVGTGSVSATPATGTVVSSVPATLTPAAPTTTKATTLAPVTDMPSPTASAKSGASGSFKASGALLGMVSALYAFVL